MEYLQKTEYINVKWRVFFFFVSRSLSFKHLFSGAHLFWGGPATLPVTFVIAPGLKAVLAFLKYFYYDICTWIALIQNALIFSASVSDDTH